MQLVFSRFLYAPTTHVFHRYLMDAAVVSSVYEDRLALLHRTENIIKACSLKISVIDGKGKRASLLRIRVLCPHESSDDSFLKQHFEAYRNKCSKVEYKRRNIFWEQHFKWVNSSPPDIEQLKDCLVVLKSIISAFKQDLGVEDDRTIRHYKSVIESKQNTVLEVNHLKSRVKGLQSQIGELEQTLSHSQRKVSELENELKNVKRRLVCRH